MKRPRIVSISILILLIWAVQTPRVLALTPQEIFDELAGPIVVTTQTGRVFSGQLHTVSELEVVMRVSVDQGGVEYVFRKDEVRQLRLPGSRLKPHVLDLLYAARLEEGLSLMELVFVQREPFFSWLPASEIEWFIAHLHYFHQAGRNHTYLSIAKRLLREASEADHVEALKDAILLGYFLTGAWEEAEGAACDWTLRHPRSGTSALGWWVKGSLAEQEEDWERAFSHYLRPIVFSGIEPVSYLDDCYTGAIRMARMLEDLDTATRLEVERRERSIAPEERRSTYFKSSPTINHNNP